MPTTIASKKTVENLEKRHPGFRDAVTRRGTLSKSGHHVIESGEWDSILDQFGAREAFLGEAEPMNPIEVAKHLKDSMTRWIKAGKPIAPDDIFEERIAICEGCEQWNPKAWLGLGGCRICKCSRVAQRVATSQCPLPIPKWISWQPPRMGLPRGD